MTLTLANEIAAAGLGTNVSRDQAITVAGSVGGKAEDGMSFASASSTQGSDFRFRWLHAIAGLAEGGATIGGDEGSDQQPIDITPELEHESLHGAVALAQTAQDPTKDLTNCAKSAAAGEGALALRRRLTHSLNAGFNRVVLGSKQSDAGAGMSAEKGAGGAKLIADENEVPQAQTKSLDRSSIASTVDLIVPVAPAVVLATDPGSTMRLAVESAYGFNSDSTFSGQDGNSVALKASCARSIEMSQSSLSTSGEKLSAPGWHIEGAIPTSVIDEQAAVELPNESAGDDSQNLTSLRFGNGFTSAGGTGSGDERKSDRVGNSESFSNPAISNPQFPRVDSTIGVPPADERAPLVERLDAQTSESSSHASGTRVQRIRAGADGKTPALHNSEVTESVGLVAGNSGVLAEVGTIRDPMQSPSRLTEQSTMQNAFSALDSGTETGHLSWTHAGPQHAEAGFIDPTLGWVSVRADLHGGAVHAAVVASSSDSASGLGSELAGLSAYLADQQIPVKSITVSTSGGQQINSSDTMQHGNGHGSGREAQQAGSVSNLLPVPGSATSRVPFKDSNGGTNLYIPGLAGRGTHISVRV